jgi:hypothetical protein
MLNHTCSCHIRHDEKKGKKGHGFGCLGKGTDLGALERALTVLKFSFHGYRE